MALGILVGFLRGGRAVPRTGISALTSKRGPRNFYKGKGCKSTGRHTSKGVALIALKFFVLSWSSICWSDVVFHLVKFQWSVCFELGQVRMLSWRRSFPSTLFQIWPIARFVVESFSLAQAKVVVVDYSHKNLWVVDVIDVCFYWHSVSESTNFSLRFRF